MSQPLRLSIPFRVPRDGVLEDGLSLAYEPVPVKSSVVPSGLSLAESEGNPEEIVAAWGFLDGIEFPVEIKISTRQSVILLKVRFLELNILSTQFISRKYIRCL